MIFKRGKILTLIKNVTKYFFIWYFPIVPMFFLQWSQHVPAHKFNFYETSRRLFFVTPVPWQHIKIIPGNDFQLTEPMKLRLCIHGRAAVLALRLFLSTLQSRRWLEPLINREQAVFPLAVNYEGGLNIYNAGN